MIDNYRQLLHKTILNTSGPKRRNKKAEKKKPQKPADSKEPLPETAFTLEMELQRNLVRGLLRVRISRRRVFLQHSPCNYFAKRCSMKREIRLYPFVERSY